MHSLSVVQTMGSCMVVPAPPVSSQSEYHKESPRIPAPMSQPPSRSRSRSRNAMNHGSVVQQDATALSLDKVIEDKYPAGSERTQAEVSRAHKRSSKELKKTAAGLSALHLSIPSDGADSLQEDPHESPNEQFRGQLRQMRRYYSWTSMPMDFFVDAHVTIERQAPSHQGKRGRKLGQRSQSVQTSNSKRAPANNNRVSVPSDRAVFAQLA